MKTKLVAALIVLCILAFISPAQGAAPKLTAVDKSFISDASEAGASEVQRGELADKNSSNPDVKAFADMMIKDHTAADDELEKIVTAKGGKISKYPGTNQKADILPLELKKGPSFDKAYARQAVADHKKAVALFSKAASNLDDTDLKAFAKRTLPTLKHHLLAAQKLAAKFPK